MFRHTNELLADAGLNGFEIKSVFQKATVRAARSFWGHCRGALLCTLCISIPLSVLATVGVTYDIKSWAEVLFIAPLMLLICTIVMAPAGLLIALLFHGRRIQRHALALAKEMTTQCCPSCGYEIRPIDVGIAACPECGTFITRRPRTDHAPVIGADGPKYFEALYCPGLTLSNEQIEDLLIRARGAPPRSSFVRSLIPGGLFVATVFLSPIFVHRHFERFIPWWPTFLTIFVSLVVVVAVFVFVLIRVNRAQARRLVERVRQVLRSDGYEVCGRCGQYLGGAESTVVACTRCGVDRRPM